MAKITIEGNIDKEGVLTCNIEECKGDTNTVMHLLSTTAAAILKHMAEEDVANGGDPTVYLPQLVEKYANEWLSLCFFPSVEASKRNPTCFVNIEEFKKQLEEARRTEDTDDGR